ncbi:hypothetical protein [Streptomyces sp. KL116D]|uniref:hypothetical protein n=1 Tax=Streptomyces sp. KL116D TaxID=3045152 RepID=UPI0035569153
MFCTSLAGRELSRFTGVLGLAPDGDRFAEVGQQAPQYVLEDVLRQAVRELPAAGSSSARRSPPSARATTWCPSPSRTTLENGPS